MPEVQSTVLCWMRSVEGLLLRLESEGRSRTLLSTKDGVDGGVENVSVSGIGEYTACMSKARKRVYNKSAQQGSCKMRRFRSTGRGH